MFMVARSSFIYYLEHCYFTQLMEELKRGLLQSHPEQRMRMEMMRARAVAAEYGAGGFSVQYQSHRELRKG